MPESIRDTTPLASAPLASALFLETLAWATDTREAHGWLLYLLPVAGLALGAVYRHLAGTARPATHCPSTKSTRRRR